MSDEKKTASTNNTKAIENKSTAKKPLILRRAQWFVALFLLALLAWLILDVMVNQGRVLPVDEPKVELEKPQSTEQQLLNNNTKKSVDGTAPEEKDTLLDYIAEEIHVSEAISLDALVADEAEVPPFDSVEIPEEPSFVEQPAQAIAPPQEMRPSAQLLQSAGLSAEQVSALAKKNQMIQLLQCQLKLMENKHHTELLKAELNRCYAVLLNAGMQLSDYRMLNEMDAEGGIATQQVLKEKFTAATKAALRTSHKEVGIDSTWLDEAIVHMRSLFVIRKKGWQEGEDVEAVIGRAEHHLYQSEYKKSAEELSDLPQSARLLFMDYIAAIQRYLAYADILATLDTAIKETERADAL